MIAILAGMLLPSLGKAKERGRTILCTSNLKNCGLLGMMYMDDNRGVFWNAHSSKGVSWARQLFLTGYADNVDVTRCPSTPVPQDDDEHAWEYTFGAQVITWGDLKTVNLQNVSTYRRNGNGEKVRPSEVMLFVDSRHSALANNYQYGRMANIESGTNWGRTYLVHDKRANFAFVDGHVASLKQDEIFEAAGPQVIVEYGTRGVCARPINFIMLPGGVNVQN